jgi:biotin carboxylase
MGIEILDRLARESGLALWTPSAERAWAWADKERQRRLFDEVGLPTPPWRILAAGEIAAGRLPAELGRELVLQPLVGSRGEGVFAVSSSGEAAARAQARRADERLLVSRRIEGVSVNVAGVVGRTDVRVGWPSVQIEAVPGCCDRDWPFAYCGNDYAASADLPARAIDRLFAHVETLAEALRRADLLGLFGVDCLYDGEGWFLLEVNARFQGSTPLQARLEREAGTPPLVAAHLDALAPGAVPPSRLPPRRPDRPLRGAQILLYQPLAAPHRATCEPFEPGEVPPGFTFEGEPLAGTVVHPRALLGRWIVDSRVLDASLRHVGSSGVAAVAAARRRLGLARCPPLDPAIRTAESPGSTAARTLPSADGRGPAPEGAPVAGRTPMP